MEMTLDWKTLAELSAKGPQQPALRAGSTMTKVTAS